MVLVMEQILTEIQSNTKLSAVLIQYLCLEKSSNKNLSWLRGSCCNEETREQEEADLACECLIFNLTKGTQQDKALAQFRV